MRGARRNPPFAFDEDGGLRPPGRASQRPIGSTRPTKLRRGARKSNSMPRLRQNNTTGKSAKTCPALSQKIFRFRRRANQWFDSGRLTREEGRVAIVTKRAVRCGGRGGAFDERP